MRINKVGIAVGVGISLAVATGVYWMTRERGMEGAGKLRAAPKFSLKDATGKLYSLEDNRGNWVVLHFWASWCPPCLDEIPRWLTLAKRMQGASIRFIAISEDTQWKDALKILPVEMLPAGVLSLLDETTRLADDYGTYQFPETYLLTPKLEILTKWVGPQDWDGKAIESDLRALLQHSSSAAEVK